MELGLSLLSIFLVSIIICTSPSDQSILTNYERVFSDLEGPLYPARNKREAGPDLPCALVKLTLRKRNLQLCLRGENRHSGLAVNDAGKVEVVFSNRTESMELGHFHSGSVEGYVIGELTSSVNGYIYQKRFYGSVRLNGLTFWVERAEEMEPHIKIPEDESELGNGINRGTARGNAIVFEERYLILPKMSVPFMPFRDKRMHSRVRPKNRIRTKRIPSWSHGNTDSLTLFDKDRDYAVLCSLYVIVDDKFFDNLAKNDSMLAVDRVKYYIREADAILRTTDFDYDGTPDNIGLEIDDVKLFASTSTSGNYINKNYYYSPAEYLEAVARFDFTRHCLGIGFTYRRFEHAHGGMGYPARLGGPPEEMGGICQTQRTPKQGSGELLSMNSLAITTCDENNKVLPSKIIIVNLLHTLGHSFGARDDDTLNPSCLSGGSHLGSYIMAPQFKDGKKANNWQFSACSVVRMRNILELQGSCLLRVYRSFCGNGLVEKHEQCDCGSISQCQMRDNCCGPRGSQHECMILKDKGYICSTSQGPCCSSNCLWKNLTNIGIVSQRKCNRGDCTVDEDVCATRINCDKGLCTHPPHGTPCGSLMPVGGTACFREKCQSIECIRLGLDECQCPSSGFDMCATCCQTLDGQCMHSLELTDKYLDDMQELLDKTQSLMPLEEVLKRNLTIWNIWNILSNYSGAIRNKNVHTLDVLSLDGARAVLSNPSPPYAVDDHPVSSAIIFQRNYCLFYGSITACRSVAFRFWPEKSYCVFRGAVAKCYHEAICRLPSKWVLSTNKIKQIRPEGNAGEQRIPSATFLLLMLQTIIFAIFMQ